MIALQTAKKRKASLQLNGERPSQKPIYISINPVLIQRLFDDDHLLSCCILVSIESVVKYADGSNFLAAYCYSVIAFHRILLLHINYFSSYVKYCQCYISSFWKIITYQRCTFEWIWLVLIKSELSTTF